MFRRLELPRERGRRRVPRLRGGYRGRGGSGRLFLVPRGVQDLQRQTLRWVVLNDLVRA